MRENFREKRPSMRDKLRVSHITWTVVVIIFTICIYVKYINLLFLTNNMVGKGAFYTF